MNQRTVLKITDGNKRISITTPGYWSSRGGAGTIHKLQKLSELKSQNDIELHVEVMKRGSQMKIGDKVQKFSDLDTGRNDVLDELKK